MPQNNFDNCTKLDDYWIDCIHEALYEAEIFNVSLTQEQTIARIVQEAHHVYGESHGEHHKGLHPLEEKANRLKAELEREQNKTICLACGGSGSFYPGDINKDCCRCFGKGFIYHDQKTRQHARKS